MSVANWIDAGVGVVLLLTLGSVLWYAYETRRMRQEMERQRLAAIEPIIVLEIVGWMVSSLDVMLSNVGKGPAFNIECSARHTPDQRIRLHSLPAGDSYRAAFRRFVGTPDFPPEQADIIVKYEDQYGIVRFCRLRGGNLERGLLRKGQEI